MIYDLRLMLLIIIIFLLSSFMIIMKVTKTSKIKKQQIKRYR